MLGCHNISAKFIGSCSRVFILSGLVAVFALVVVSLGTFKFVFFSSAVVNSEVGTRVSGGGKFNSFFLEVASTRASAECACQCGDLFFFIGMSCRRLGGLGEWVCCVVLSRSSVAPCN